jgi:hypothetical protein
MSFGFLNLSLNLDDVIGVYCNKEGEENALDVCYLYAYIYMICKVF